MTPSDDLTNIHGLAAALRLPKPWLIAQADAGRLPALRVGRALLFNISAVREALAKMAAHPPHDHGEGHDHD